MKVPCGKCLDCLRKYQNDWSIRMYEEYKSKGCKGVFFTLTYDEAHVPKNFLVDGEIYRSKPDYGFGNVHVNGYNVPSTGAKGVRKKYAETVYSVLTQNGITREQDFQANQDVLDFNEKRGTIKHRAFMKHLQRLFADYWAMSFVPFSVSTRLSMSDCDIEEYLNIDCITDDFCKSWKVNEDTGELTPKADYQSPESFEMNYRERPIVAFNSVRKEDIQLWLKRCRTRWNRQHDDRPFSYFITSEYGPSTLRPHYHGCLFGVSKDEVRDWFHDWQVHYGKIVDYDDLDMTKGGLNYVSKYCSKGMFEHPLCSRDFFYFYRKASSLRDVYCSEYHSKHYEKCIQWFGIDAPIVDPTFHLVSKGLGVDWCKKDVPRCKEFDKLFASCPAPSPVQYFDFSVYIEGNFSIEDLIYSKKSYEEKFEESKRKWLDFHEHERSVESWLERFSERCCYKRNFVSSKGETVVSFGLPKYYRAKMFSPALCASYSNFVQSKSDALYREKLGQLASGLSPGKDFEAVNVLVQQEQQETIDRYNNLVKKYERFYKKSQL